MSRTAPATVAALLLLVLTSGCTPRRPAASPSAQHSPPAAPVEHQTAVNASAAQQQYRKAALLYLRAAKAARDPVLADRARYMAAEAYLNGGNDEQAYRIWHAMIWSSRNNPWVRRALTRIRKADHNPEQFGRLSPLSSDRLIRLESDPARLLANTEVAADPTPRTESDETASRQHAPTIDTELRAEAMYWTGRLYFRLGRYRESYLVLKRMTQEHIDTDFVRSVSGRRQPLLTPEKIRHLE